MKNETLSDSSLLQIALQSLRSIAGAKTFNDNGDKMIMAGYSGFANASVREIEGKLRLRKLEESIVESRNETAEQIRERLGFSDNCGHDEAKQARGE